jgi:hypothetical protein
VAILLETDIDAKFGRMGEKYPLRQRLLQEQDYHLDFPPLTGCNTSRMQRQTSIFAPRSRKALLAAVLILLGYIGIISHAISMDLAHADDCQICLQIKTYGNALTSGHALLQPPVFSEYLLVVPDGIASVADFYSASRSRAPPLVQ